MNMRLLKVTDANCAVESGVVDRALKLAITREEQGNREGADAVLDKAIVYEESAREKAQK